MNDSTANSLERPQDIGTSPEAVARRWKLELKLADKRESTWRKKAAEIYKKYTPESPETNSFNILWTNTETLRQSVYNSLPQPDVRRRYQDEDPLGKAVSEVLTRALEFAQDTYDFDAVLQDDVLCMLLAGRTVSRVRYVPDIHSEPGEAKEGGASEPYESIAWEQVICERVQYDDFRILGPAKCWNDVPAIAFRHRMTRDDCIEKFGEEIGKAITLDAADDEDIKNDTSADLFKTAEIWEIWDKDSKRVIWICKTYAHPCKEQDDPLQMSGFFPIPRPLYAIQNDQTLIPACLFTQYEQQAKELNKISMRINKLIDALRVRGIYDATLGEMAQLMKAADNELIPGQNITALLERGGLEKAIWMMPIDVAAAVLKELYVQRDATKQVIYEITGISDIMRSASDPNETFGAQKIKTQWGTQRLQRMQKEVQRYIRDLVRLKAEVISEKFQIETLEQMTLVQLPHQAQVDAQMQQMQAQYQQAAQMAQQQGQQPPPPPQMPPAPITWEAVSEAMRGDATRTYHVDIETDSTLLATQDSDMDGLTKLLGGLSQLITGFGPAVQAGAIPIEAVKALMGVVVRRAKMGTAVEDALEKMQAPAPGADPEAAKAQAAAQQQQAQQQHEVQLEQMKAQTTAQLEQMKASISDQQHQRELAAKVQADQMAAEQSMAIEQHKQQMQDAQVQRQNEMEAQRAAQQSELEHAREVQRMQMEDAANQRQQDLDRWKAELDASTKITVAEIAAKASADAALAGAEQAANGKVAEDIAPDTSVADALKAISEKVDALHQHSASPRTIVRGPDGKATGISVGGVTKTVTRDPDGRATGVQ
jgi:hypothetical protein